MKSFIRYFCFYCASRLLFNGARSILRRAPAAPAKCTSHVLGLLLGMLMWVFVLAWSPALIYAALVLLGLAKP